MYCETGLGEKVSPLKCCLERKAPLCISEKVNGKKISKKLKPRLACCRNPAGFCVQK